MKTLLIISMSPLLLLSLNSCDSGSGDSTSSTATTTTQGSTVTSLSAAFNEFDSSNTNIYLSDSSVVIETNGRPNHTSPYWSTTHSLYTDPTVTSIADMAPGNIDDFNGSYSLTISAVPQKATSPTPTGLGAIGIAISGAVIYNDQEGPGVPIDSALPSLDYTGAHTGPQSYHYHIEPVAWSTDDTKLIGIIADGFFLYGRRDYDGSYPTDLDSSGGHFGPTPHNLDGEYHYHIQNTTYLGKYLLFPGNYQGTPNNIQ